MEWFFTADKKKRTYSIAVRPNSCYLIERIGTVSVLGLITTANIKFRHAK